MSFEMTQKTIDISNASQKLANPISGGYVSFEGWVRNHNEGQSVDYLEYQAYESMCYKEAAKIIEEAKSRYAVTDIKCIHRIGALKIGEVAIWIGAASIHRDEAFRACRYVIDEVKLRLPIWKKEHYTSGKAEWVNCQECYKHSHHYSNEKEETQFYSKQVVLNSVGKSGQKRLKESRVLVVGAGGLGCPVALSLAGAGIGEIHIYDGDVLEVSNLQRQTLYKFADVGRAKALLAEEAIKAYNPFIRVQGFYKRLALDNIEELIKGFDVVLDCTDNFKSQYLLHDACYMAKTPLVQANVYKFEGELQVYTHNKDEPCLRCYSPILPEEGCTGSCVESGTFGFVTQYLGALQAQKAIEILLGKVIKSEKIIFDLETLNLSKFLSKKNESCEFCSQKINTLCAKDYEIQIRNWEIEKNTIDESDFEFEFIDVRSSEEIKSDDYNGFPVKHIPSLKPEAFVELGKNKKYVVICQSGLRSGKLVEELHRLNYQNFLSLKGGVNSLSAK